MMIRNALLLAWDNIIGRAFISFSMVVICAISIYVFDEAVSDYFDARQAIDNYEKAWDIDTDSVCQIKLTYLEFSDKDYCEMLASFVGQLNTIEGAAGAGCYYYSIEEFLVDGEETHLMVLHVSPDLVPMKNITQKCIDIEEDEENFCFVGANVDRSWSAQRAIINEERESINITCELKESASWFSDSGTAGYRDFVALDDCVVIPEVRLSDDTTVFSCMNSMYVILENEDTFDVTKKSVQDLANACGFSATISTVDTLIQEIKDENREEWNEKLQLAAILGLIGLFAVVSSLTVTILMSKRNIGIFLAFGHVKKEFYLAFFFENTIKIALAFIVEIVFRRRIELTFYDRVPVRGENAVLVLITIGILFVLLSTGIPCVYLRRKEVRELL